MVTPADKPWFFVVRTFNGEEHHSLEYGDLRGTQDEIRDKRSTTQRFELPDDYRPTLDQAIDAWKRGVRIKPIPKAKVDAPVTRNPYKARILAKLRARNADPPREP